ncbi:DUF6950 family protein [Sphingobium sp. Z007]|uniref:DUF6950 family protein n=1 Tax=Sphingobium sp. Z007 TaxID=627495 RepID=UPI000B4A0D4A|nr:hypothetical protein [Sphingobium sp. Z007]
MTIDLKTRAAATQATMARFRDQPFTWGRWDCVRMAAFHLRQLGHRPGLGRGGAYKTALGAKAALRRAGHDDLAAALDAMMPRIAPAQALVGDLIMCPGTDGFGGGIAIAVGNGRMFGYHEDSPCAVVQQPLEFLGAWRV